jgi:acyl carrier protein
LAAAFIRFQEANSLSGSIPIGRAIANTQLYVLDRHLQPVPIGVAGELHIGGLGVARGYLNRPDLTAEKFIANPFSDEPGSRLYKTGDRARYRPDGTLEFLGRLDDQVKIRGYRIELGEIEAVLLEHSGVQEAVVLVQEDGSDRRLVAYIVLNQESPAAIGELSEFLKEKLPEYMIPSTFLTVPLLPLTANGKVDRRSLLAMEAVSLRSEVAPVLPSNSVESAIANVWQEVLQVERVSIHDNFFDIGGHSLLLAEVHRQLREILKADLSLIELLEYPTIYSLAKHLTEEQDPELEFQSVRDRVDKQKSVANRQKQLRMQR